MILQNQLIDREIIQLKRRIVKSPENQIYRLKIIRLLEKVDLQE